MNIAGTKRRRDAETKWRARAERTPSLRLSVSSSLGARSGFTLVELMVAIALVLVLMLGVSRVFKATTDTVSAGQSISDNTRDARAAQAVIARDMETMVQGAPFLMMRARVQPAFRNRQDELADRNYQSTDLTTAAKVASVLSIDLDGSGTEGDAPGELVPRTAVDQRNHRIDSLVFFTRGLQRRQTGNETPAPAGVLIANQTCYEQFVCYGPMKLDGTGVFNSAQTNYNPGDANFGFNADNFYATQWIFGRAVIQLSSAGTGTQLFDRGGVPQAHFRHTPNTIATPFTAGSTSSDGLFRIQDSRYDVAAISISEYEPIIAAAVQSNATDWWQDLLGADHLFQTNPFIVKDPLGGITSRSYSQQFPVFLPRCTQMMFEYAGDFVSQNANGTLSDGTKGDGVIDFVAKPIPGTSPAQFQRLVRWYGFPRDTDPENNTGGVSFIGTGSASADVVPLRDFAGAPRPFEKFEATGVHAMPASAPPNYAAPGVFPNSSEPEYTCVWRPTDTLPRMIRVTFTLDDPAGRLAEGQTFEYVYELP